MVKTRKTQIFNNSLYYMNVVDDIGILCYN